MHEMSYIIRLVNLAAENAEKQNAASVEKITVSVGKMTGIEPYYMQKYYKTAIKGTVLEGSVLELETVDVAAHCENCGSSYTPDAAHDYLCPACGSGNCKITAGRDVVLKQMTIRESRKETK